MADGKKILSVALTIILGIEESQPSDKRFTVAYWQDLSVLTVEFLLKTECNGYAHIWLTQSKW